MVALGFTPLAVDVILPRDADFVASIDADDDTAWPDGTQIALVFSTAAQSITPTGLRWQATITGASAAWDVDKTDVATVLAAGVSHVRLLYTEPDGTEMLWGKGVVRAV